MPTLFIPHGGGPCFFMESRPPGIWVRMAVLLRGIPASLPARPSAILVISGHWETPAFTVGSGARPSLIFDYSGFPEHTYRLRYDAPGSPALARRVKDLLVTADIPASEDAARGYDHGVFILLKVAYCMADGGDRKSRLSRPRPGAVPLG
jgi:aromatic ring-opening dioxygenase catalytic subunit (LigB family)